MAIPKIKSLFSKKSTTMSYKEIMETLNIKVIQPEENFSHMSDIVGLTMPKEFLSQTASFLNKPNDPKTQKATIVNSYILIGRNGSGRSTIAHAFAKEVNLPIVIINSEKFVSEKATILAKNLDIVLAKHHPAVIMFKNFEYVNTLADEKQVFVYSKILDCLERYTDCVFFVCVIPQTELLEVFYNKDAFETCLQFEIPDLSQREELIKRFISKYPHDENLDISKVARNTYGMNAGELSYFFSNVYNYAIRKGKDIIDFECVDTVLSSNLFGYKQKTMTDKERKLTAYHEAGHVIAGYFSNPNYRISKVEIAHRSKSLGLTISEDDEDKLSFTKEDYELDIIECYGGMVAEKTIFQTNTSGVAQDLAMASKFAEHMVKYYGMNDTFGPISIIDSEGCFYSEALRKQADFAIRDMLNELYNQTLNIIRDHTDALEALSSALLEKETLYREEIIEILTKYKN